VHLDDLGRIVAGLLMQTVDVLRDEAMQLTTLLNLDDGSVAAVRLRRPGRSGQSVLPGGVSHLGLVEVVLEF